MTHFFANMIVPTLIPPTAFRGALLVGAVMLVSAVEAPFIKSMCRVSWRRAILASLIANVVSTLLGLAQDAIADLSIFAFLVALPVSVLSEWVLLGGLVARQRDEWTGQPFPGKARLLQTAVLMNLASYLALSVLTFAIVMDDPHPDPYEAPTPRAEFSRAAARRWPFSLARRTAASKATGTPSDAERSLTRSARLERLERYLPINSAYR